METNNQNLTVSIARINLFYKKEILELMKKNIKRSNEKKQHKIVFGPIMPEIVQCLFSGDSLVLITESDVKQFFEEDDLVREFSKAKNGTCASIEAPILFDYKNNHLKIIFTYRLYTKDQPEINLN